MQLGYTILYVPDVPATLKFYEAALALPRGLCMKAGTTASWKPAARCWRFQPTA